MIWRLPGDGLRRAACSCSLIGLLTLLPGLPCLAHPLFASGVLTVMLAVYFILDGIGELAAGIRLRPANGWALADALRRLVPPVLVLTSGGATFGDPVLDFLVAEAQRLNPGVRTAGLRILEARAQLGCRQRTVSATATGDGPGTVHGQP